MSGPSGVGCQSRTEEIVDRWAQDAGIVGKDEHVKTSNALGSSKQAWAERNDVHGHDLGEVAGTVAREGGTALSEHFLEHGMVAAGAMAGILVAGTVQGAYHLYKHWAESHAKGDDLANRAHNDAVNCALASKLAFHPRFGQDEQAKRPGVTAGTDKLMTALSGKDADLLPILQGRADEGFNAMERAYAATSKVPADQRGVAMSKWLDDNGFADRRKTDIAFQKGGEYFLWTKATRGVDAEAEAKLVHHRLPPEHAFACKG